MMKKLFAFAIVISLSFWALAPGVSAMTTEELQVAIDDLLAQLATLRSELADLTGEPTTTIVGCTITSFDRNLSQGMTGDDVKCLQIVLNSDADTKLADSDAGSPGNETTYFGPITKAGAIKFQEKYADEVLASWGLTSGTGYIGSTSRAKLNTLLAGGAGDGDDGDDGEVITGGFSVALSADTPVAGTVVTDSTSDNQGGQVFIPALKVKFSNGNDSDVAVTEIKIKRSGISADADISQAYLFDGDTKLAEYNSLSSGVLTFSGDLFTVEAGKSKTITFKFDLTNNTGSGKTIYFSILSADDITSDAASVGGTFPLTGNIMTTAQAGDLGQLTIATSTDPATTLDPDENIEVFNFNLTGADQILHIKKIKFTNIGSTAFDDLTNIELYDGGIQLLTTIENMDSDKTITFDFGDDPLVIDKGVTKPMHLRADISGGTNRTFQFSIQEQTDTEVYDTEYGIYIKPNASGWVVQKATASTINTGKLSLSRASDSPSGNVSKGSTNVTLAKFDLKALGEDVKIATLIIDVYGGVGTNGLYQAKIYYDGSQKGVTTNASTAAAAAGNGATTFTFGNTFIVEKGLTKTLEIRSDIKTEAAGAFSGGETLTAKVKSTTATGRTSLATVSTVSSAGHQLTIGAGTLSAAINSAVPNWSTAVPTGVPGQTEALVASFVVTGNTGEGADITAIKVTDDGAVAFGNLQNLKVYKGTKDTGTQIGTTQSSLTTNTIYNFYPSPSYISINANEQIAIYIYADIKTATTSADGGTVNLAEVDGTGKITNTSVNYDTDVTGQTHTLAAAGALSIANAADRPLAANLRAGETSAYTFHKMKFTAGTAEDIQVTRAMLDINSGGNAPSSTISEVSLWDGSTQVGETRTPSYSTGRADFNLITNPWTISAGATKYLTIKAKTNVITSATSGATIAFSSAAFVTATNQGITYKGAVSGAVATSSSAYTGYTMYIYKTTVNAEPNALTPSDPGSGDGGQYEKVLIFDVENEGSYSAYLNTVTTTVNYSQGRSQATTTAARLFYIYKDGYPGGTVVASTSLALGDVIDAAELTFNWNTAEEIAPGDTKAFTLIADARDCKQTLGANIGSSIGFQIADGADFNWDDELSTAIHTNRTKTFPLLGNDLQF